MIPNRVTALAITVLAIVATAGLFADWVYASGISEQNSISGISTWLIFGPVGVGTLLLLAGATCWQGGNTGTARVLYATGSVAVLIPAFTVVLVTEMVQAWLPSWLAPVLTNSDAFAFRAGVGAWSTLIVAVGGLAIAAIGIPQQRGSGREEGVSGYVALVSTLVGASGLMVLRARPFAQVQLNVENGLVDQVTSAVGGSPGEVATTVGEFFGDPVAGTTRVNLVAGDIPLFGQITLLATVVLIVSLIVMVLRPGIGSVAVAASAAGTLTMSGWLLSSIVVTIDTVIPETWLAVDGYAAAAASTTTSIWWLALWSMVFSVGLAGVTRGLGAVGVTGGGLESKESDVEFNYDWGKS